MSLYDDASLIVYPSGYKESKIYAQKPIDGTGDLTFARASSATRVNEQGLIETPSVISTTELVTNGDFATDITGWLQYQSVSTWDSGTIKTTVNSVNAYIRTNTVALTGGIQYKVTFKAKASNISQNIIIYNGATFFNTGLTFDVANTYQEFTYYLDNIAVANLIIGQQSLSIGDSINFDNVSVKEVITSNIPRIDYTGGGCGKLLLEPQRTNEITYSEDFSGNWSTSAVTINSNAATSPDGVTNASKIIPSTSTSVKYIFTTAAVVSGVDYIFSFFAKAGGYDYVSTYISALGITGGNWNLATGVATGTGRSMEDYGNGWWRCTGTGTSTGTSASCRIYSHPTASSSFTGNGVDGVYVYGAQVEAGSYPTSYIPTSGTTVTRNRDTSLTSGLSSVINSVEGVIFLEMAALANDSTNRYISINNGTSSKRIIFKFGTSSNNNSGFGLRNG